MGASCDHVTHFAVLRSIAKLLIIQYPIWSVYVNQSNVTLGASARLHSIINLDNNNMGYSNTKNTLTTAILTALLYGCGGSGGDSSTGSGGGSGSGGGGGTPAAPQKVAYRLADQSTGQFFIYSGTVEGGATTLLSPMTNANGNATSQFRVSPDGEWVAYIADAEDDGEEELYVSRLDGTVIGQKMSPDLPARGGREIDNIVWSPDSNQIAFVMNIRAGTSAGDGTYDATYELYVSTLNGAIGVRVSGDLAGGRESDTDVIRRENTSNTVSQRTDEVVQWAPDGSRIAYIGDFETNQVFDLYTTTPDGNTNVVKVSGTMVNAIGDDGLQFFNAGSRRDTFAWAPDSQSIAFRAQKDTSGIFELYLADNDSAAEPIKLQSATGSEDVYDFEWAPDGSRIAYEFFNDSSSEYEMYTVTPDLFAVPVQVSGAPGPSQFGTMEIAYFAWSPDSTTLAYTADQRINSVYDLYVSAPDTSVGNLQISPDISGRDGLISNGDVAFEWSADSSKIAYLSNQDSSSVRELYVSTPDASVNEKLSGSLGSGQGITEYEWSPDSMTVAYIANQDTSGIREIYASDAMAPVNNRKLNPTLVTGGNVDDDFLQWSDDSSRVLYLADQDIDEEIEFYSSTRDGLTNTKISDAVVVPPPAPKSFSSDIFPQMSGCNSCHTHSWFNAGDASQTRADMAAAGRFDVSGTSYFIVRKLNGEIGHSGGTFPSLATDFQTWIDEGANDN